MEKTMNIQINIKGINEDEKAKLLNEARFAGTTDPVQYNSETQELTITVKFEPTDEQLQLLSKRPESSFKAFLRGFSSKLRHCIKVILGAEKEVETVVV